MTASARWASPASTPATSRTPARSSSWPATARGLQRAAGRRCGAAARVDRQPGRPGGRVTAISWRSPVATKSRSPWPASWPTRCRRGRPRAPSSSARPMRARSFGVTQASLWALAAAAGVPADTFRDAVAAKAADYAAEPLSAAQLSSDLGRSLDRLIGLFDLLAVLAVVIGGLGIVNTLAVGVLERGREIAILRSHGMTVGQVQAMVVTEAAIMGAVGGMRGGRHRWSRWPGSRSAWRRRTTSPPASPSLGAAGSRRAVGDRRRLGGRALPGADRGRASPSSTASSTSNRRYERVETRFWEAQRGARLRRAPGDRHRPASQEIERFCAEQGHPSRLGQRHRRRHATPPSATTSRRSGATWSCRATDHHEITSFTGNVSIRDGKPFLHAHAGFASRDGGSVGGHLLPGCTVFVGEVTIREMSGVELEARPRRDHRPGALAAVRTDRSASPGKPRQGWFLPGLVRMGPNPAGPFVYGSPR